ncbi:hypothetical protein Pcinc_019569 [Petrolisthes cinctipes]|uniref:Uncharacterized protein n=1 Tax=Petrolisthes cinctipes TaxID=88211 RepID=A0AAE1FJV4_PETCI|nr:hypothetical protein Pcinc_019569 [Petrolisthes cinctipes]
MDCTGSICIRPGNIDLIGILDSFLGLGINSDDLVRVADHTSFEKMKAREATISILRFQTRGSFSTAGKLVDGPTIPRQIWMLKLTPGLHTTHVTSRTFISNLLLISEAIKCKTMVVLYTRTHKVYR